MTATLETLRLLLRPLKLEDAEQIQAIFPHWDVVRLLAGRVPWPYPPDGAYSYIRDIALPAVERGDEWHWMLRLKTKPDQLIGCISLMKGQNDNRGFWLGLSWQRQGLMSETCEIVTDFWFETLRFAVLRAPKAVGNIASRRQKSATTCRAPFLRRFGRLLPMNGGLVAAHRILSRGPFRPFSVLISFASARDKS